MGVLEDLVIGQNELILQNDFIKKRLEQLETSIDKSNERILSYQQIMDRLGLKNWKSFNRRMDDLIEFGMYKEGQWRMMEVDLKKFLASKKDITPALRV